MKIIRHPLFMRPTPESELEQAIDRELRRLPDLRAPADLLPRVLQIAGERMKRPWWRKPVVLWPPAARFLFLVVTAGLAGVLFYFTWGISVGVPVGSFGDEIAQFTGRVELARSTMGSLGGAAVMVARSVGPWLPWSAAAVVVMSYLTTVGLGTCCYRLISGRV